MNTQQKQVPHSAHPGRRLWIVELEKKQAHIYERTDSGTQWIGDARMDHGHLCLDIPDLGARYSLPCAPRRDGSRFLACFAEWLGQAEKDSVFDKAVLVGEADTIIDLRPELSKRLGNCVKLAPDEMLAKNASEDRLAECMWL